MDAISFLEKQHREVEKLFKACKKASGKEKEDLFLQIADDLAVHSTIEEKIFYPACKADNTEDLLEESLQEHLSVKRLLADMLDMDPSDERFDAKLTVLEEQVMRHVEEEENVLFKRARRELGKNRLEEVGEEMVTMAEMLKESDPHEEIPNETQEAPHI